MKINLILTGGTIGSAPDQNGVISKDTNNASKLLLDHLYNEHPSYKELIEFDISSPIDLHSENLSLTHWNELISHLKTIDFEKTDGIIMTHGSDTLAFTANLMSLLFDGIDMPVCIVASAKPLTDEKANGHENFKKAVDLIIGGANPCVYVPYRNKNGETTIHGANRLIQCADLSPDFESAHHKLNNVSRIHNDLNCPTPILKAIKRLKGNILTISPHPGLHYGNYDLDYVDAVLHRTYHSSTVSIGNLSDDDNNSILTLKKKCDEKEIPLYVTPVLANSNKVYSSTDEIIKRGIIPLFDMTYEMSYIYLLLKQSLIN